MMPCSPFVLFLDTGEDWDYNLTWKQAAGMLPAQEVFPMMLHAAFTFTFPAGAYPCRVVSVP